MDMNCLVVNLFGVPSAGKSTMTGVNAEPITEFAKDKVWEENPTILPQLRGKDGRR